MRSNPVGGSLRRVNRSVAPDPEPSVPSRGDPLSEDALKRPLHIVQPFVIDMF
jgi:hypothetical protein